MPGHAPVTTRSLQIRRIDPLSAGKLLGAMYALIGLVFGLIWFMFVILAVVVGAGAGGGGGEAIVGGIVAAFAALIFGPLFYGAAGFISGFIGALLYNFMASMVGGIVYEVEG
jgi:lipopolysaccharide export LptBFGC system permease protein LptF